MRDQELIVLYKQRDERAITETQSGYGRYLRGVASRILALPEDVDEVENDTYLTLWNTIPPAEPDPLKPYAGTICRRLSINRFKAENSQKRGSGEMMLSLDELEECIPDAGGGPIAEEIMLREILNDFLKNLGKRERQLFLQRYWYVYSLKEIAACFGISEAAVKMRLHRTREKMRVFLEKEGVSV